MVKLDVIRLHEIALEYAVARGDIQQSQVPPDIRDVKDPIIERAWKSYGVKDHVRETISRELNAKLMARPTLNRWLKKYPRPPKRAVEPEYKRFWDIPTIKSFTNVTKQVHINNLLEFWLIVKKNPENWGQDEYALIDRHPSFSDSLAIKAGAMSYNKQQSLRAWCKYSNPRLFARLGIEGGLLHTKGHKRKKGRKREWFLTPSELARYIEAIPDDEIDHLTVVLNGAKKGDRWSGMCNKVQSLTYGSYDFRAMTCKVFEPKTGREWIKPMDKILAKHIRVLHELRGKPASNTPVIEKSYSYHLRLMKQIGMKAGLAVYKRVKRNKRWVWVYESGIPMSLHLLRHTFALICSINNVPLEMTADLGGWEDINTLKDFYYYVPPEKLVKAYNGINWDKPTPQIFLGRIQDRYTPPSEDDLKNVEGVE